MNIAAAFHCYEVARNAGNREGALRHLHRIRAELKSRRQSKPDQETIPTTAPSDRVRSIFDSQ